MVVPGDPFEGCQFDRFPRLPWGAPMNQFRLVQAVDRFSRRIIVAVAPAADRRLNAGISQPFAVANADVLGPSIGVVYRKRSLKDAIARRG